MVIPCATPPLTCLRASSPRWGEEVCGNGAAFLFSPVRRRWQQPDEGAAGADARAPLADNALLEIREAAAPRAVVILPAIDTVEAMGAEEIALRLGQIERQVRRAVHIEVSQAS